MLSLRSISVIIQFEAKRLYLLLALIEGLVFIARATGWAKPSRWNAALDAFVLALLFFAAGV